LTSEALTLDELKEIITGRPAIVLGAGPSLAEDIIRLQEASLLDRFCLIAADGATTGLLRVGRVLPQIVATDLDGRVEDQVLVSRGGCTVVIHGHGDNMPAMKAYVPRFKRRIGSTQVEPKPNVYSFGGFTDGDRAAFLAVEMGASALVLVGMDFGNIVGEYSKPQFHVSALKHEKLGIGLELLEWLATRTRIPLYNATRRGVPIKGFKRVEPVDLGSLF